MHDAWLNVVRCANTNGWGVSGIEVRGCAEGNETPPSMVGNGTKCIRAASFKCLWTGDQSVRTQSTQGTDPFVGGSTDMISRGVCRCHRITHRC